MGDTEPRSPAKVEPRPVGRQPSVAVTEEEFRARPGCLDRAAGRSGAAAVMTRGGGRPQDGLRCAACRAPGGRPWALRRSAVREASRPELSLLVRFPAPSSCLGRAEAMFAEPGRRRDTPPSFAAVVSTERCGLLNQQRC